MFKEFGFIKEYYVNNKFMGTITFKEIDREVIGYNGRTTETLEDAIIFENKKKIKAGTEVMTMLYPLCGKMKK
tara:strand:+ start:368 stop:586 length:219 start_codon:yes stop_codon:yes gene_type:complete